MYLAHRLLRHKKGSTSQQGFTMVELLVTIVLMLLITVATIALYGVNSQSSKTVDSVAALDDTARFVFEVMGRSIQTAGYIEVVRTSNAVGPYSASVFSGCVNTTEPCPLLGFDNSIVTSAANNYGSAGSGVVGQSDSLTLRYAGSGVPGGIADNSAIDCLGGQVNAPIFDAATRSSLAVVSFYVNTRTAVATETPELYCRTSSTRAEAIAQGVETMQFLYAIDTDGNSVPNRWVRASDVTNWAQVRAIRIGMVLRGELGSAQTSSTATLYPLGKEFSEALGGDALFTPPADTRLRKVFSATFFLRNEL
jgi:type IV pilus assembly protein PilW